MTAASKKVPVMITTSAAAQLASTEVPTSVIQTPSIRNTLTSEQSSSDAKVNYKPVAKSLLNSIHDSRRAGNSISSSSNPPNILPTNIRPSIPPARMILPTTAMLPQVGATFIPVIRLPGGGGGVITKVGSVVVTNPVGTISTPQVGVPIPILPTTALPKKADVYQQIIDTVQKRLDFVNNEIGPVETSSAGNKLATEKKGSKKNTSKQTTKGKASGQKDTAGDAAAVNAVKVRSRKVSKQCKDSKLQNRALPTSLSTIQPSVVEQQPSIVTANTAQNTVVGKTTEVSPDSIRVQKLVSDILTQHSSEVKEKSSKSDERTPHGYKLSNTGEAVPESQTGKSASSQPSLLQTLLHKLPSYSNTAISGPSPTPTPSINSDVPLVSLLASSDDEKSVTTADSDVDVVSVPIDKSSPLHKTVNTLADFPPADRYVIRSDILQ